MTSEEFLVRMEKIAAEFNDDDPMTGHDLADDLLVQFIQELDVRVATGKALEIYNNLTKRYA